MPWGRQAPPPRGQSTFCRNTFLQSCSSNLYRNLVFPRPGKISGPALHLKDFDSQLGCQHTDLGRTGCLKRACVLLRNTAHQRSVLIFLTTIASEWLNPLYEMPLACKNWACFKWMTSPHHTSINKRLRLSAQMLLCLARPTSRQKSPFLCMTSFCSYYPTTKTESLHPIQSWLNSFSTYERKATMSIW